MLYKFVQQVPRIYDGDIPKPDDVWKNLPYDNFVNGYKKIGKYAISTFYKEVMKVVDQDGNKKFRVLGQFPLQILSQPTSNADAERLFLKVNPIKAKYRNSLHLPTISAIVFISEYVRSQGGYKYIK